MAEPVSSASAAAAADNNPDNEESARLPKNAEDRKAAAALNSLNANEISQDASEGSSSKQPSAADQEALGKAMSRLEIASGGAGGMKKRGDGEKNKDQKKTAAEAEVKKKVKIAAEDVALLVEELDLTKVKATELLRSHDGDAVMAIRAFIAPPAPSVKA